MALITNVVQGSASERLLLLVHGYGADERDLGGLLPYLDQDGRFAVVLPRGPLAAPGTPGFAWYEFTGDVAARYGRYSSLDGYGIPNEAWHRWYGFGVRATWDF